MLIECTKKLLDELGIKPGNAPEEEPLFCWHANLLAAGRKKTLVLVNDSSRYVVVMRGLKAKDFKILDRLIPWAIKETLREECIKEEVIDSLIERSGAVTFAKTRNRTMVARLNKGSEIVQYFEDYIEAEKLIQCSLSKRVSRIMVGDSTGNYFYPNEKMCADLQAFAGIPVFRCRAAVIRVDLELENHRVWRRLAVPLNMTFHTLHEVFQKAFGWKDYHQHEFFLYENDVEVRQEDNSILSEFIPPCENLKYNYDFGDFWQHYVKVESIIENYDKNYPSCLEGEGDAPPEDVGGERGYDEFLAIISDDKNEDYKSMIDWARGQRWGKFDIEQVNRSLKNID